MTFVRDRKCVWMNKMNVKAGLLCGLICLLAYRALSADSSAKQVDDTEASKTSYMPYVVAFAVGMIAGSMWFADAVAVAVVEGGGVGGGENATIAAIMQEIDVSDPCF